MGDGVAPLLPDLVGAGTPVMKPVVEVDVPEIPLVVGAVTSVMYLLVTRVVAVAGTMDVEALGMTSVSSSVTLSHWPAIAVRLLSPVES